MTQQTRLARLSKAVGWNRGIHKAMSYPKQEEVVNAINYQHRDEEAMKLLSWNRFLPSPVNKYQRAIIDLVAGGMAKLR